MGSVEYLLVYLLVAKEAIKIIAATKNTKSHCSVNMKHWHYW